MADKKYILVKSGRLDAKVVLFEKDDAHPGGEAFVAASEGPDGIGLVNEPVEVGRTALVDAKIHEGQLIVVEGGGRMAVSEQAKAEQEANAAKAAELEAQAEQARKDAVERDAKAKKPGTA